MVSFIIVKVIMPQSLHTIDPNAFNGATNSVIYGIKNSYAQEYAKQYQIAFMDINSFGQEILTKNIDSNITKQSDLPEVTLPLAIIKSGTSNISYTLMYAILEYMDIPYDLVRSPVRTVHLQSGVGFPTDEPAFYIYYGKNNEKMVGYYFEADSCSDLPIGTPFKTIMVAMGFKEYNGFDGLDYIFNIDEELERTKENLEWSKANGLTIIGLHLAGQEERNDNLHYNEKIIELVVPYCDLVIVTEESDLDGKFTNLSDELKIPLVKIDKLKASSVVPLFQDIFDIE